MTCSSEEDRILLLKNDMHSHCLSVHCDPEEAPYICRVCDIGFRSKRCLDRHCRARSHKTKFDKANKAQRRSCFNCSAKPTIGLEHFSQHYRIWSSADSVKHWSIKKKAPSPRAKCLYPSMPPLERSACCTLRIRGKANSEFMKNVEKLVELANTLGLHTDLQHEPDSPLQ